MTETIFLNSLLFLYGWIEKQYICSKPNELHNLFPTTFSPSPGDTWPLSWWSLILSWWTDEEASCCAAIGEPFSTVYRQIAGSQL